MPTPLKVLLVVVVVLAVLAFVLVRRMRAAGVYVYPFTKFGPAVVLPIEDDEGNAVRVLSVGGMFQSATYLDEERRYEPVFGYYKQFDRMFEAGRAIETVLMIGGGGYAYPKHFVASRDEGEIDVVEIDPAVTRIAYEHFFLNELVAEFDTETTGRLNLFNEDGRAFLEELAASPEGIRYDAVVLDSFGGNKPVVRLVSVEAMQAVQGCLAPQGLFLANVVAPATEAGQRYLDATVATLYEVFAHVWVIPCGRDGFGDNDNNLVIASDGAYEFAGAAKAWRPDNAPILHDDTDLATL